MSIKKSSIQQAILEAKEIEKIAIDKAKKVLEEELAPKLKQVANDAIKELEEKSLNEGINLEITDNAEITIKTSEDTKNDSDNTETNKKETNKKETKNNEEDMNDIFEIEGLEEANNVAQPTTEVPLSTTSTEATSIETVNQKLDDVLAKLDAISSEESTNKTEGEVEIIEDEPETVPIETPIQTSATEPVATNTSSQTQIQEENSEEYELDDEIFNDEVETVEFPKIGEQTGKFGFVSSSDLDEMWFIVNNDSDLYKQAKKDLGEDFEEIDNLSSVSDSPKAIKWLKDNFNKFKKYMMEPENNDEEVIFEVEDDEYLTSTCKETIYETENENDEEEMLEIDSDSIMELFNELDELDELEIVDEDEDNTKENNVEEDSQLKRHLAGQRGKIQKNIPLGKNIPHSDVALNENINKIKTQYESKLDELKQENEGLKQTLKEYKDSFIVIRKQINEVQTFNAKLAYANKLFINGGLTNDEKIKIAEEFDKIETIEEAKKLYNTFLNEMKVSKSQKISTTDKLKSANPAIINSSNSQTLYESTEIKRMKTLAGISKKNEN